MHSCPQCQPCLDVACCERTPQLIALQSFLHEECARLAIDKQSLESTCRDAKVNSNGMATVTVQLSYDKSFPAKARSESSVRVRSIPGGLTVLPPIVAVVLAVATRNVLVALFCGIWVAAFFIHACDLPLLQQNIWHSCVPTPWDGCQRTW